MLLHRRPPGKAHAGLWEFPGGKLEPGESPQAALVREMREETDLTLDPGDLTPAGFATVPPDHHQPRAILLLLFSCTHIRGEPNVLEGGELGWFAPGDLADLPMPAADRALLETLGNPSTFNFTAK